MPLFESPDHSQFTDLLHSQESSGTYLNNYFDFHVCLSFRRPSVRPSVRKITQVTAVITQNVTNKSCLLCVMSEKYAFLVTLRLLWSMRQGKV